MTSAAMPAATGYVRVPRAWISLSVSPGAKALLLQLCAAANERGESWYSYAQLGEIVRRSRAAVAGYVDELRAAGVVATLRQRTANGFNYRLKIRLIGWSAILVGWAGHASRRRNNPDCHAAARERGSCGAEAEPSGIPPTFRKAATAPAEPRQVPGTLPKGPGPLPGASSPSQPLERRVQPAERKDPTGPRIKNHQNNTRTCGWDPDRNSTRSSPVAGWSAADEAAWKRVKYRDSDGHLGFDERPDRALLQKVIEAERSLREATGWLSESEAREAAGDRIERFVAARRLEASPEAIAALARVLAARARTSDAQDRAIAILEKAWGPHWRRLSTPGQLEQLLSDALKKDPTALGDLRLLGRFGLRATMARRELLARARLEADLAVSRAGKAPETEGAAAVRSPASSPDAAQGSGVASPAGSQGTAKRRLPGDLQALLEEMIARGRRPRGDGNVSALQDPGGVRRTPTKDRMEMVPT